MTKLKVLFSAIIVLLTLNGELTAAEVYKWVDENGVIHFKDTPPLDVTPSTKIEKIPIYDYDSQDVQNPGQENENKDVNSKSTSTISEKSKYRKTPRVELYTTSWCHFCKKARDFFHSRGIPFSEYDIDKDKAAASRKKRLDKGGGVPLTVINGKVISGFSEIAYKRALKANP